MAPMTRNEPGQDRADLAAAAMDRGREQLESAKGQLAEGAERVADAVERTADELDGEGEGAISGFGRSVASLTRQLAGGLRERDVEEFAQELATLARRNPGVFLAGSVALGFGIARFFKARTPSSGWDAEQQRMSSDERVSSDAWRDGSGQQYGGSEREFDAEDGLDLSSNTDWQSTEQKTGSQRAWSSDSPEPIEGLDKAAEDALSPTSGPEATSGGKP